MIPAFLHLTGVQVGLIVIAVLLCGGLVWYLINRRSDAVLASRPDLLPPAERELLGMLEQALNEQYQVYPRIRLADIAGIRKHFDDKRRPKAHARLDDHRADYVLCTKQDLTVIAIIAFSTAIGRPLRQLCRDCGVALIPLAPSDARSVESIRAKVTTAINSPNTPELGALDSQISQSEQRNEPELPGDLAWTQGVKRCPACAAAMTFDGNEWFCPVCHTNNPTSREGPTAPDERK